MTRIKVCGIMSEEELAYAVMAGADALGFVVEIEDSRHCLSAGEAADLIRRIPVYTKSVAVIAPHDVNSAVRLAEKIRADVLQLHGKMAPRDLAELKSRIPQKLVAAMAADAGIAEAKRYGMVADAILLDSMVDGKLGGTGRVHDWDLSAEIVRNLKVPVILAGGLHPGNVAQAIERVRPYAVDVSSGLESSGKKDPAKIRSFVQEVRRCPAPQ
jgi:phosphoribosylanthranilate isomerase